MLIFDPKVSIVIPVFNGSSYLGEAIASALAQTYKNIEILVINDGSQDEGETEKIALSYGNKIKYYKKTNGGVASALNLGIEKMSGEYFSWLSHDDLYFPNKIESQIDYLSKLDNRRAILYSDFGVFSDNKEMLSIYHMPTINPLNFRYAIAVSSFMNGCTLLIPKGVFDECGLFNTNLRHIQDYDMWFRMAKKFHFIHVNLVLVKSRFHQAQDSNKYRKEAISEIEKTVVGFFNELTDNELREATSNTPEVALACVSMKLASRGLYFASKEIGLTASKRLLFSNFENKLKAGFYILLSKLIIFFKLYSLKNYLKNLIVRIK